MKRPKMKYSLLALLLPLSLGAASSADSPWICSVAHYVECNADRDCTENDPEVLVDTPGFFTIDLEAGVVHASEARFSDRSSPILHSDRMDGRVLLTGMQTGRAWSITLVEETGEVSLAISDPDASVLVFGRCIATTDIGS